MNEDLEYPELDAPRTSLPYFGFGQQPLNEDEAASVWQNLSRDLEYADSENEDDLQSAPQSALRSSSHRSLRADTRNVTDADFDLHSSSGSAEESSASGSSSGLEDLDLGEIARTRGKRGRPRGRSRGGGRAGSANASRGRASVRRRPRARRGDGFTARGAPKGPRRHVEPGPEFKQLQTQATTLYLKGDFEGALEYAKKAVQINPEIFAAHSLLSRLYDELDKPEAALGVLWSGAHTQRTVEPWREVAKRTEASSQLDSPEVIDQLVYCYSQIIRLDPNDYETRFKRLKCHIKRNRTLRALAECQKLCQSHPYDLEVLQTFAGCAVEAQQTTKCHEAYEKAIEHFKAEDPSGMETAFSFTDLNFYIELFNVSSDWMQGIVALKSTARWLCGRLEDTIWDSVQETDCEWDLENYPRRIQVLGFEEGLYAPEQYGEGLPLDTRAILAIFRLKLGSDHVDEAVRHFASFEPELDGLDAPVLQYPDVFHDAAEGLMEKGLYGEAIKFYEAIWRAFDSHEPAFLLHMAQCYRSIDMPEKTVEFCDQVLELDPSNIQARNELSKVYELWNEPEKALSLIMEAARLSRTRPSQYAQAMGLDGLRDALKDVEDQPSEQNQKTLRDDEDGRTAITTPRRRQNRRGSLREAERAEELQTATSDQDTSRNENTASYKSRFVDTMPDLEEVGALWQRLENASSRLQLSDDQKSLRDWIEAAQRPIEIFLQQKVFFPADMHIRFYGYSDEAKRMAYMPQYKLDRHKSSLEADADRLYRSVHGENPSPAKSHKPEMQLIPKEFAGVPFTAWLDCFLELAFNHAKLGAKVKCYKTISTVLRCNVFYHDLESVRKCNICDLACSLVLDDEARANETLRWFIKRNGWATDVYRLFALVNQRFPGNPAIWRSVVSLKILLRQVHAIDYAIADDEGRAEMDFGRDVLSTPIANSTHPDWTAEDLRTQGPRPGNPKNLRTPDPQLLTLYGNATAANGHYMNALNYYFRAYAVQPDNPLTLLSMSIAYGHLAFRKSADNRHYLVLQALAFLREYQDARLQSADSSSARRTLRSETDYNEGRFWHGIGLIHLAKKAYMRCLDLDSGEERTEEPGAIATHDEDGDIVMGGEERQTTTDTGNDKGHENTNNDTEKEDEQDSDMQGDDYKREAAFALQGIFALEGSMKHARAITERFLVF